jgi:urease accessory protein
VDSAGTAVRSLTGVIDCRPPRAVGRQARLDLEFQRRAGRTVLVHAYAEPPLRAGRCFEDGDGVHLIMASSAPGIFGGDLFEQRVRVGAGCRVRLTSQSALQVHPGGADAARLIGRYVVEDGASLRCEWEPLIPFAAARLEQCIEIDLAVSASLVWSDALMCGRQGRGERWAFEALAHELRIRRGGRLEYLERYRAEPHDNRPDEPWRGADSAYFGTFLSSGAPVEPSAVDTLHAELSRRSGVRAAADRLDPAVLLVRLMGRDGTAFHDARRFLHSH